MADVLFLDTDDSDDFDELTYKRMDLMTTNCAEGISFLPRALTDLDPGCPWRLITPLWAGPGTPAMEE
ncbi:hypothetical protein DPMN_032767 [Dreissena polymorpha]|uniref:Uncharacterized protein n=1 Tax=Dreissena polymorpha TaxID=45954 RepID=A0A9D4M4R4_DREPO|nr:hypothetical protein DPMN_032767 [Dreissena polymorpha]